MKLRFITAALGVGMAMSAPSLLACAACFGKSDSPLAQGMNWGIASLLVVVVGVLSGVATFGVYLAKRSAMVQAAAAAKESPKPTEKVENV